MSLNEKTIEKLQTELHRLVTADYTNDIGTRPNQWQIAVRDWAARNQENTVEIREIVRHTFNDEGIPGVIGYEGKVWSQRKYREFFLLATEFANLPYLIPPSRFGQIAGSLMGELRPVRGSTATPIITAIKNSPEHLQEFPIRTVTEWAQNLAAEGDVNNLKILYSAYKPVKSKAGDESYADAIQAVVLNAMNEPRRGEMANNQFLVKTFDLAQYPDLQFMPEPVRNQVTAAYTPT